MVLARMIWGSRMPSGRLLRICATAERTSSTARSIGVPIASWTTVSDDPSVTLESISSIPCKLRSAASTRCVTWVSSSVGAAPGWLIWTMTTGKSMSGWLLTSSRRKLTIPAIVSMKNRTSDGTGLRIDQAEMFRKLMLLPLVRRGCRNPRRLYLLIGGQEGTGRQDHLLGAVEPLND